MKKNRIRGNIILTTLIVLLSVVVGLGVCKLVSLKGGTDRGIQISKAVQNSSVSVNPLNSEMIGDKVVTDKEQTPVVEVRNAEVDSDQVVANIDTYLNIRVDKTTDSEVVGKFYNGNVGKLIEQDEEWSLVSSGNAYGYVKNEYILTGSDAESYIEENCDQIATVITETLNVREENTTESDILALSGEGDALTVVEEVDEWVKVSTDDDVVGYVSSEYVCLDYSYETAVTLEEDALTEQPMPQEQIATLGTPDSDDSSGDGDIGNNGDDEDKDDGADIPEEPEADPPMICESPAVTEAPEPTVSSSGKGQEIADFAVQFVGNPYAPGGTSLTNGADCSGFVMAVFQQFGYSLPRTSYSQAGVGYAVNISDVQPGDLLFYHSFGHVAIYIGNGQVVHASNLQTGIKISAYNYSNIDKIVRVVD